MRMIRTLFAFLLVLLLQGSALAQDGGAFVLDSAIDPKIYLDGGKELLLSRLSGGPFRWAAQNREELRGNKAPLTFMGLPVLDAVIRFKGEKTEEITLCLYNRGDTAELSSDDFSALSSKAENLLNKRSGSAPEDLGNYLNKVNLRSQRKVWFGKDETCRLDTAYSRIKEDESMLRGERSEYIILALQPGGLKRSDFLSQPATEATSSDLPKRVQRLANGDVLLSDVPMIDQGPGGYAAVTTMERILRYYGITANGQELAQHTETGDSTAPAAMAKALKNMGTKAGVRVDVRIEIEPKEFQEFVSEYNRLAKRKKAQEFPVDPGAELPINDTYARMNMEILQELKLKPASKPQRLLDIVSDNIGRGKPLAWSVVLGLVAEHPRPARETGGHMRLIVGFNPATKEIIYSDGWGAGHELKRMSLGDAYLITTGLCTVEPRL